MVIIISGQDIPFLYMTINVFEEAIYFPQLVKRECDRHSKLHEEINVPLEIHYLIAAE